VSIALRVLAMGEKPLRYDQMKIVLGPHDTVVLHTRWCSGASTSHSAQSIFGGVDGSGTAVTATGQVAQLAGAGKQ